MRNKKKERLFQRILLSLLFVLFVSGTAAADQGQDFKRIEKAISSGDMLEAQSLLEDFLDDYSSGRRIAKARYLLGQVYYRRAAYDEAADTFSQLLSEHPDWEYADQTLYGLAMSQIGMPDYLKAVRTLEKFLSSHEDSDLYPSALYWLGETQYRRENYSAALEKYEEFLKFYPSHGLCEYALDSAGWCLEQLGRYDDAIGRRREFLNRFSRSSLTEAAEYCLAADLLKTGQPDAAAEGYRSIVKEASKSSLREQAALRAGLLLVEMGDDAAAIAVFKQVNKKAPPDEYLLAQAALGNVYLRTAQFQNAREVLEGSGVSRKGSPYSTDVQLSLAHFALGNLEKAAAAVSLGQTDVASQEVRGLLLAASLLNLNKPDIAAEKIKTLLKAQDPAARSPELLYSLAGVLMLTRQYQQAEEILKSLSDNPLFSRDNPEINYYLGFCLYERKQYAAAAGKFEQFLTSETVQSLIRPAHYLLADAYARNGEFERSATKQKRFLEDWPDDPLARSAVYRYGLLSLLLKQYNVAAVQLEKYAAEAPAGAAAQSAGYCTALAHLRNDQPEKAVQIYKLLVNEPAYAGLADDIALGYGLSVYKTGDYLIADQIFRETSARHADSDVLDAALIFAAASRYRTGATGTAGAEFNRIAELFPSSRLASHALVQAAFCEEELNHPVRALALYGKALQGELTPSERAAASLGQAYAHMNLGNLEQALAVLTLVAEESAKSPAAEQALFWMGRLQYATGRWHSVPQSLQKLAKAFPSSALADDALFFSARASRLNSDYHGAIQLFRSLIDGFPESPYRERATIEAAECMLESGQADAAARELQIFIEHNINSPLRPLVLYDMGKALQRSGKFEAAIEQYRAAAGGETTTLAASSHFAIAECLAELDQNDEAVAVLVNMIRAAYPPGWAERAQLQVARLLERDGQLVEAVHVYEAVAQTYKMDSAAMVAQRALQRLNPSQ